MRRHHHYAAGHPVPLHNRADFDQAGVVQPAPNSYHWATSDNGNSTTAKALGNGAAASWSNVLPSNYRFETHVASRQNCNGFQPGDGNSTMKFTATALGWSRSSLACTSVRAREAPRLRGMRRMTGIWNGSVAARAARAGHASRTVKRLAALVLLSGLAGCTAGIGTVAADDPAFAGLDPAVVKEVLDNPVAQERAKSDDPTDERSVYQGIVRNFIGCRSALAAYQEWVHTGTAPPLPDQPKPTNVMPSNRSMQVAIKLWQDALASGDISLLRANLTNESGCGVWIPAKPNDVNGPSVADVVNAKA